jgi:hypothetical protein
MSRSRTHQTACRRAAVASLRHPLRLDRRGQVDRGATEQPGATTATVELTDQTPDHVGFAPEPWRPGSRALAPA